MMTIGELAQRAYCSTQTIRYYEKMGLLAEASRRANNYRYYTSGHLRQLRFIRHCRALDLSHEEIKTLLLLIDTAKSDCLAVNDVVNDHIMHIRQRIQQLRQLEQALLKLCATCQQNCQASYAMCHILTNLLESDYQQVILPTERHLHAHSHD